uniref:C2H2-type domain-containing protein n=1 Tax=Tetranychus urticae TaxID=32264 RepID=T1KIU1_TETUR
MSSQFIPSPLDLLAEASVQRLAEEREKAKFDPSSVFYGLGQSPSSSYQPSTSSDDAMDTSSEADDSQLLESSFCEYQQSFLYDVWETSDDDIFKSDQSSVFYVPEQSPSSSYQPSTLNDEGMDTTSDSDDLESSFCEYKQSFLYDVYGTSDDDSLDSTFSCKSDITLDLKVHPIPHTSDYKERKRTKIYICEDCGYTTKQPESYYLHVNQNHPDSHALEKSYDWDTSDDDSLDWTFSSCKSDITSDLEVHGISRTYEYKERRRIKIYICEECGYTTKQPDSYYLHVLQNHPDSPASENFND